MKCGRILTPESGSKDKTMAGKSAMPLLLVAGAAALVLGGKKKKRKPSTTNGVTKPGEEKKWVEVGIPSEYGGGEGDRLVLDAECANIAQKIDFGKHNTWVTSRFHQIVAEGTVDPAIITLRLLQEQSEHCPWGDPSSWTPMMKELHDQLLVAVQTYGKAIIPS